jgi:hypothetical protein
LRAQIIICARFYLSRKNHRLNLAVSIPFLAIPAECGGIV